ncbi:DUF350 domain-containing protein [Clostridium polynesiense]|uniref:DUF350 domain-containing protein n=1 Tax=Clostridium polynesiense TaxID=1325933 RepID=UPI0005901D19|nr:DUF350 domain-containing protein [Clostridium polynesiense]
MELLIEIMYVAIYSALGIVLMVLGNFLIDLVVPCHFPTEIKKGNQAVGWISAGSFIGIGIILRTAIMSPASQAIKESLLSGILNSVLYFVLGILFFSLGYVVVYFLNRRYNLNEEIGSGNNAAGIMVFGIFVGLALVISGVIC